MNISADSEDILLQQISQNRPELTGAKRARFLTQTIQLRRNLLRRKKQQQLRKEMSCTHSKSPAENH